MVQIIQIREMILENAEENFISHMVQIIQRLAQRAFNEWDVFISHMVQIIRRRGGDVMQIVCALYIPHGSDNTWK